MNRVSPQTTFSFSKTEISNSIWSSLIYFHIQIQRKCRRARRQHARPSHTFPSDTSISTSAHRIILPHIIFSSFWQCDSIWQCVISHFTSIRIWICFWFLFCTRLSIVAPRLFYCEIARDHVMANVPYIDEGRKRLFIKIKNIINDSTERKRSESKVHLLQFTTIQFRSRRSGASVHTPRLWISRGGTYTHTHTHDRSNVKQFKRQTRAHTT